MDDLRATAHLLRRTGFGPRPGEVERLAAHGYEDALRRVLAAAPLDGRAGGRRPDKGASAEAFARWWLARMADPRAGLHEKMTWFWHSHFTTSSGKVDEVARLGRQLDVLHRHALGHLQPMVMDLTIDPAMLQYLDGDGSTGDSPNENYARELMELFTLGRGAYSEADVRSGARALSGWTVEGRRPAAVFDETSAFDGDVTFLGVTGRLRAADVAQILTEQAACPAFLAGRIHRFLVGRDPDARRRAELADLYRASDLDTSVLVAEILRHPDFLLAQYARPRFPVEWVPAAMAAMGLDNPQLRFDTCTGLGQVPYDPPNVAGWPVGTRWLSAGQALGRAALAVQSPVIAEIAGAADPVAAALGRCSLFDVSAQTTGALRELARGVPDAQLRSAVLLSAAVSAPEFALA